MTLVYDIKIEKKKVFLVGLGFDSTKCISEKFLFYCN